MVQEGLVTLERVEVRKYTHARRGRRRRDRAEGEAI